MAIKEAAYIWSNGRLKAWQDAKVHVLTHALHYGTSIFEGIRAYDTPNGTVVFRLKDHIKRFFDSAKIYRMDLGYNDQQLTNACFEVLSSNKLRSAYLRPLAFMGYGHLGLLPPVDQRPEVAVIAFEWGAYLGEDSHDQGVDVGISSWQRVAPNTVPTMAKAGGNYLPARLISMEARAHGYQEGIALDAQGFVSEGPGENIFLVSDGVVITPPIHHSVLPGITRDSVMKLAQSLGYEVREQTIPREWLYLADEVFFTGTAAEVVPVKSVDRVAIGDGRPGPITSAIQASFFGLFSGGTDDQWGWLEPLTTQQMERAV